MTEHRFIEIDRQAASLDAHMDELNQTVLAAQRLIRAYDRAAHEVVAAWETREYTPEELARAVVELQRVYERRQV